LEGGGPRGETREAVSFNRAGPQDGVSGGEVFHEKAKGQENRSTFRLGKNHEKMRTKLREVGSLTSQKEKKYNVKEKKIDFVGANFSLYRKKKRHIKKEVTCDRVVDYRNYWGPVGKEFLPEGRVSLTSA